MALASALVRLTYCGNVHPAEGLPDWLDSVRGCAATVALQQRARGREFGLGAFWPAPLAALLASDHAARAAVAEALAGCATPLWTLNAFPFSGFHDEVVKTRVYAPDWAREERLLHTRRCAEAGAALLPAGAELPISTLPLGYRPAGAEPADLRVMARNLARAASAFAAIEDRTGVTCVLALEPEPDCLLETCAAAALFLEQWLFDEQAWITVPAAVLRRHLGVCVDLCHLAVAGEDPLLALSDLRARGIAVPKIQLSSCLEVRDPSGLDRLLAFAEPRYLHQTVAATGARAPDLDEVARRRGEFAAAGRLRTHFHMPLYWDEDGPFGSTRREVERVLRGLRDAAAPLPLLEVETYTWPLLPAFADVPLADRLQRELDFAAELLGA